MSKFLKLIFGIISGVIVLIMLVLGGTYLFRNQIIKLALATKDVKTDSVDLNIKERNITLKGAKYQIYSTENIFLQLKDFSIDKKEVHFSALNVEGLNFYIDPKAMSKSSGNDNKKNTSATSGEKPKLSFGKELEVMFDSGSSVMKSQLESIKGSLKAIEKSAPVQEAKEKLKNTSDVAGLKSFFSKDNLKSLAKAVTPTKEDAIKSATSEIKKIDLATFINPNNIEKILDAHIEEALEPILHEKILEYGKAVDMVQEQVKKEKSATTDEGTAIIDLVTVGANIYGIKLVGEVGPVSNKITKLNNKLNLTLKGMNSSKIALNLKPESMSGNLDININEIPLTAIPTANEFVTKGVVTLGHANSLQGKDMIFNGTVRVKDLAINSDNVVKIALKDVDKEQLKYIVKEMLPLIKYLNIDYSYNSKTRKLTVHTNIAEQLDAIIRKDGERIVKGAFANEISTVKSLKDAYDTATKK